MTCDTVTEGPRAARRPHAALDERRRDDVTRDAPGARILRLDAPPVLGAAHLALDRHNRADCAAAAAVRAALTHARLEEGA